MAKVKEYIVLSDGVENDKTGKRFEKGAKVTNKDFKQSVIRNWLKTGVLGKQESEHGEG